MRQKKICMLMSCFILNIQILPLTLNCEMNSRLFLSPCNLRTLRGETDNLYMKRVKLHFQETNRRYPLNLNDCKFFYTLVQHYSHGGYFQHFCCNFTLYELLQISHTNVATSGSVSSDSSLYQLF